MDCLAFIRITIIIIICIGSERRCGQLKKTTDLFIFHLPTSPKPTTTCKRKHGMLWPRRNYFGMAIIIYLNLVNRLGRHAYQYFTRTLRVVVFFLVIILQAQSVLERMQRLEFPFAGINVSVSLSLSLFVVDKLNPIDGDDDDDINTSHNHTNIYPTNALLMSHPIHSVLPRINSLPILLQLLLHSNSEVFVADSFG